MITAVTLGIALAFEPTEPHTMRRPPRSRDESLLGGGLLWHIVLVAALFLAGVFGIYDYAVTRGDSDALARTLAMNTLVTLEIFHLLFIRNFRETALSWSAVRGIHIVWGAIGVVLLGQLCITYLPALQGIFGTEAVPPTDLLLMLGMGMALFGIIEAEKQLRHCAVTAAERCFHLGDVFGQFRQGRGIENRLGIGADQPARPQLRPAEIAHRNDGDVDKVMPRQNGEARFSRRPLRFAIVAAPLDDLHMLIQVAESRHEMAPLRVLLFQTLQRCIEYAVGEKVRDEF